MTRQASRSAFFAILLTGAAAAAAGQTDELVRTLQMEPGGRLELDNFNGETTVTGVDGDELTIRATKRLVGPESAEELDRVEIRIEERGGRVVVEPRYRRSFLQSLGNLFGGASPRVAVDFTVTVPRRAGVTIDSFAGDVAVEGVEGETRVDVFSGDVRLRAVESQRVAVETFSGSVTFDGAFADDGRYEFESYSGDVHLSIPEGSGFEIVAESFSGKLRSGFPIRIGAGERAGETAVVFGQGSRSLRGVAAGGGARVTLSTFSGDLSIDADALEIDLVAER